MHIAREAVTRALFLPERVWLKSIYHWNRAPFLAFVNGGNTWLRRDFPLTLLPDLTSVPFSLFHPFYYPEATIKHELIIVLPRYSDLSLVSSRRYIMQHLLTLRCIMERRELRPFIHYRRRRRHSRNSFLRPANLSQMRINDSSLILKTSRFSIVIKHMRKYRIP